jgi:hypothetical protein
VISIPASSQIFITLAVSSSPIIQVLRRRLKAHGIHESWGRLRKVFAGQCRVTATFKQRDGRTLHVRKTTMAESKLKRLYEALGLSAAPVGVRKLVN